MKIMIRKLNKVSKIIDNEYPKLKGYIMFEDNWIGENDKILSNNNGDDFLILDIQEIEERVLQIGDSPYESGWRKQKFSCVKLDKEVTVGDLFFIK